MQVEQHRLGEISDNNKEWIRQALYLPRVDMTQRLYSRAKDGDNRGSAVRGRLWSPGEVTFGDTSMGGNRSINPRPQFTEDADINVDSLINDSLGMGRYYYEAIDQNAQRIYLQAGTPQFNSLTNFFTTFYDFNHANLVNRGVVEGFVFNISKLVGFVVMWPVAIPLSIMNFIYRGYRTLSRQPLTRFYYLRPNMHLYWQMVTNIFNAIITNMQILHSVDHDAVEWPIGSKGVSFNDKESLYARVDSGEASQNEELLAGMQKLVPDIYKNHNGGIDIRATATRWQRMANKHNKKIQTLLDRISKEPGVTDVEAAAREELVNYFRSQRAREPGRSFDPGDDATKDHARYIDDYTRTPWGKGSYLGDSMQQSFTTEEGAWGTATEVNSELVEQGSSEAVRTAQAQNKQPQGSLAERQRAQIDQAAQEAEDSENEQGFWYGISQALMNFADDDMIPELQDGASFVSFIVDYQGDVGESFSNSTTSSSIADAMNQKSKEGRNIVFNMAGGNVGDNPLFQVAETAASVVTNALQGLASGVGLSGLGMLGGGAFVDIPDFWDDAQSTFSSTSYNIKLRSWSGHPYAIMQNIVYPLSCLLPFAVPRKTGHNSYGQPFLCKLWSQGRSQIQLGLVTEMGIQRGTGNVAWNPRFQATGVDVNFSVMNLSKMLAMPVTGEVSLSKAFGLGMFDEEDNFTDYMGILAGLSLADQHYHLPRIRLKIARAQANFDTWLSTNNMASFLHHRTMPGQILSGISDQASF